MFNLFKFLFKNKPQIEPKKQELETLYKKMKTTERYKEDRKNFYKIDYRGSWATNYEKEIEFDETQPGLVSRNTFLYFELKEILERNQLEISDDDYMGAVAATLLKDGKRIKEFFRDYENHYSQMEVLYFFVKENYN